MAFVCPNKGYRENNLGTALCTDITKFYFQSRGLHTVNYLPKQLFIALGCSSHEKHHSAVCVDMPSSLR